MKKILLSMSALVVAVSSSAQTWTELPVVTNDYTSYSSAKVQVDPVTNFPNVAFKGRKDASGAGFNKAIVYEFADGKWNLVAISQDNVASSYIDFKFSTKGYGYIAYADNDSTPKGTTIEQICPKFNKGIVLGSSIEKSAATYVSLSVPSDGQYVVSSTGNTSAVADLYRKNGVAIFSNSGWSVSQQPTSGALATYKTILATAPNGSIYQLQMERGNGYNLYAYLYNDSTNWKNINYPTQGAASTAAGLFKVTTDASNNFYTLIADNHESADGKTYVAYVRKFNVSDSTWSTLPNTLLPTSDSHINADFVVLSDGSILIAYSDPTDEYAVKSTVLKPGADVWSEAQKISSIAASSTGDLSVDLTNGDDVYVAYVDASDLIHVIKGTTYNNDLFNELVCDTLDASNFGLTFAPQSGYVKNFSSETSGISYLMGGYAYVKVLQYTMDDVAVKDTTIYGMNIRKRASNGVYTGFYTAANESNRMAKAVRVEWISYNSSSMAGRNLQIYGSSEAYQNSITGTETMVGEQIGEVEYNAGHISDVVLTGEYPFIGIRTNSTGFGISKIVVGWSDSTTAIESVESTKAVANTPVFNLQGQRVEKANAGIYIQGNRKMVVR